MFLSLLTEAPAVLNQRKIAVTDAKGVTQLVSIEQLTDMAIQFGIRLALFILLLYVGNHVAKWIGRIINRALSRARVEPIALQFLTRLSYVILFVLIALTLLQAIFKVQPSSIIAVLGAAGLAIGLALKDSLSNVASGVMLVTLKPFRVGDSVDIAGKHGTVETVSIFQTRIRGDDNETITVPNNLITTAPITNHTPDIMRRIKLLVGIGYSDDIDEARTVAIQLMQSDDGVLDKPAPAVTVSELGDNAVILSITCYTSNANHAGTKARLTENIKKAFDTHGISIPYVQRDVHLYHHNSDGDVIDPPVVKVTPDSSQTA